MSRNVGFVSVLLLSALLLPACTSAPQPGLRTSGRAYQVPANLALYARELGGKPHRDSRLFLIVGNAYASDRKAEAAIKHAMPYFGDMQTYLIVQNARNFASLPATGWVVVEAFRDPPSPENLQLIRRAFPRASVHSVIVRTSDPIPVYEELVGRR